jgi:hypothetical protein
MLTEYENMYLNYKQLLDAVGTVNANNTEKTIPGYDISTNVLLSTASNVASNQACLNSTFNNPAAIASVYYTSTGQCKIYGNPTGSSHSYLRYAPNSNATTNFLFDKYYLYMLLGLNAQLVTYVNGMTTYISAHSAQWSTNLESVKALDSQLTIQGNELQNDRLMLSNLLAKAESLNETYDDSYVTTVSKNSFYNLWFIIACISVAIACMMCYSIIAKPT